MPQGQGAQPKATFYMGTMKNEVKSATAGRPIFDDVPFVRITTPGDKDVIINTVAWIDENHPHSHSMRFPEAYARFRAGHEEDTTSGTPLKDLPGITSGQVEELAHFHVRTVEQLADLPDAHLSKFRAGQQMAQKARDYIQRAKGAAVDSQLRAEVEKREAAMAAMQNQMNEQNKRIEELLSAQKQKSK